MEKEEVVEDQDCVQIKIRQTEIKKILLTVSTRYGIKCHDLMPIKPVISRLEMPEHIKLFGKAFEDNLVIWSSKKSN